MRRIAAAAVAGVCLIGIVGSAAADGSQTLAISNVAVNEGAGSATFTVTLTEGDGTDPSATVDYATEDGSAAAPGDYSTTSGTATVPAGGSDTFTVPITNDTVSEGTESFTVKLSNPSNGTVIGDDTGTGTINDNDSAPSLAISGPVTVNEAAGTATYSVAITGQSASTVSVNYAAANGTATSGSDFTLTAGSLSWPSGDTAAKQIVVNIANDALDENDETFSVNLSGATGATIADGNAGTTITDNDATPALAITGPATVNEAAGTASYSVAITGQSASTVSVNYAAANGTATSGSDFTLTAGSLSWPSGDTAAKQITVNIANDALDENDETFSVNLSGATGATIADGNAGTTITDNDDPPTTTTFADVSTGEGNSGSHNLDFTVNLSGPSAKQITINYSTIDGTATTANSDYTPKVNQPLTIPAGQVSRTISIPVTGDTVPEPNETFTVNLNSGTDVTLGADTQALGTIANDDNAVTASIDDVTVTEGNSPTTVNATFTVSFSGQAPASGTITYRTSDGTATSPADYTSAENTLSFAAGATSAQVTVAVKGDGLPEPSENFFVDLVGSTGPVNIADSRGTGTITDDDSSPTASINDVTVTEGNSPNTVNATFTISLSAGAPAPATVTYRTTDGSATSPADYTGVANTSVPFGTGATSAQVTIVVKGDGLPEAAETFFVDLVATTGPVTIGDSRGAGTITDDDSPASASINDVTVTEGNTGTVNATFTVQLSSAAPAAGTITFRTTDGTATSPADYNGVNPGSLPIAAGATSAQITIAVKGDLLPEGTGTPLSENFFVDLVGSTGPVTISSDSRGIGTIVDNDSPVTASINDVAVTEGNTGTVNAIFTVQFSGAAPAAGSITYRTTDGSATSPGDYTGVGNTQVPFAAGATTVLITVPVKGDTVYEGPEETFFVDLISTTGPATINTADSRGSGTITEDEPAPPPPPGTGGGGSSTPLPSLTITDPLVKEGADASFTITLAGDTTKAVTVRANTTNGSATGGEDFVMRDEVLTFAPGEKSKTVTLTVLDDTVPEEVETFWLRLSTATNASIAKQLGTATIEKNDQAKVAGDDPDGVLPRMVLGPATVNVFAQGFAIMTVACHKASKIACSGTIVLEKTGKPVVKLGTKAFTVQKGTKKSIRVYLSARALKLLTKTKTGTMRARAVVLVKNSLKKSVRVVPGTVTLKATKGLLTQATTELKVSTPKPPAPPKLQIDP